MVNHLKIAKTRLVLNDARKKRAAQDHAWARTRMAAAEAAFAKLRDQHGCLFPAHREGPPPDPRHLTQARKAQRRQAAHEASLSGLPRSHPMAPLV